VNVAKIERVSQMQKTMKARRNNMARTLRADRARPKSPADWASKGPEIASDKNRDYVLQAVGVLKRTKTTGEKNRSPSKKKQKASI